MRANPLKTVSKYFAVILASAILAAGVAGAGEYKRQSNNEKSVRVDVLPVQLKIGEPMIFDVKMNTHSVTLNSDLVSGSSLLDNTGKEYKAVSWDGTPPGSHHRSGTLEFDALTGNPQSVTLMIKGVSNVPQRVYKWNLQ